MFKNVFFTHNDSGDTARFFAVGPGGRTIATYDVEGARAVDWEDVAQLRADDVSMLYFGDIGDNRAKRPNITVYGVLEPEVDVTGAGITETVATRSVTTLTYPDAAHDAETLFVLPETGEFGIVTKEPDGHSGVYLAGQQDGALHRVATIDFAKIARPSRITDFAPQSRLAATGGEVSPDGRHLIVRTYVEAFEWDISAGLARGLGTAPKRVPLPPTRQGEAISYTRDGDALLTTSEQLPAPVYIVSRPR